MFPGVQPSVKRNTGLDRLDYLFASLKRYEPGHAPAQNYENVFITTRALILLLKMCADGCGSFTQADRTMLRQMQRAAVFGEMPTDARVGAANGGRDGARPSRRAGFNPPAVHGRRAVLHVAADAVDSKGKHTAAERR